MMGITLLGLRAAWRRVHPPAAKKVDTPAAVPTAAPPAPPAPAFVPAPVPRSRVVLGAWAAGIAGAAGTGTRWGAGAGAGRGAVVQAPYKDGAKAVERLRTMLETDDYSKAARAFAARYARFDAAEQNERMVDRMEELLCSGPAASGAFPAWSTSLVGVLTK